ncbi:MAG: DEAD/DEAH box helicase family protein [Candidatus Helarchaeota archaeon]
MVVQVEMSAGMKLRYHRGTIIGEGEYSVPQMRWDTRKGCYRAPALYYREIIEYLRESKISFEDGVLDLVPCPVFAAGVELRGYQKEALERWMIQKRGVVVMPTGSGKTHLALKVIEEINSATLIVVPTLDLIQQWREKLHIFKIKIGEYSGVKKELEPITVTTYDSARIHAEYLGNKFKVLIFDEVHHLAAEGYRQIAELFAAPFRLGLTATYERADGLHKELPRLIGGKVYEIASEKLVGRYLAPYETIRVSVDLTEPETEEYETCQRIFRDYLVSRKIRMRTLADFKKLIMRSGSDRGARKALLARNKAERIAYNSRNKLEKIRTLLSKENRTIIFTRFNDMVYEISKMFLIPCITYRTDPQERREILRKFKEGKYSALVSSQVLDEGIDVPEADVGIIVSGTGSKRAHLQRLGRLLRPRQGKTAVLYELVTKGTKEVRTSYRRKET